MRTIRSNGLLITRSMGNCADTLKELLKFDASYAILGIRKAPTPKVDASRIGKASLRTPPILWVRQDRHFFINYPDKY